MSFSKSLAIIYLAFSTVTRGSSASVASTCDTLSSRLPARLSYPGSLAYNDSISSYFYAGSRLSPTCILSPTSAEEVSTAVSVLGDCPSVKFAIRGAGHNSNSGFANIESGVTIDMRAMNGVEIVENEGFVRVGAGALWENVYEVIEKRNLAVLGGRVGSVGVGGLTTGGGISFFSPEQGWVCDSVLNFQLVLANSSIINVNSTSNPDLFAALKGGSNNFGIVTAFGLRSFTHGPLWGGMITFSNKSETELLTAFTNHKNPENFDPYAMVLGQFGYIGPTDTWGSQMILFYTKTEGYETAFGEFLSIEPRINSSLGVALPSDLANKTSTLLWRPEVYSHWAYSTFAISPTILFRVHDLWKTASATLVENFTNANITCSYTIQSIPPPPPESLPNSLGFSSTATPEKNLVNFLIILIYEGAEFTAELGAWIERFINDLDAIAEEEGVKERYRYANYAAWFQDVLGSYGEESVERMRAVARKYDPDGMFQKQVPGGYKLFP